jgi:hypothetical protein
LKVFERKILRLEGEEFRAKYKNLYNMIRRFVVFSPHKYYLADEIKKDGMG